MTSVQHKLLLLALSSLFIATPAFAQDTTTDNEAEVEATVPATRIADRYVETLFGGDDAAATAAVESLRKGDDVTIEREDGTTSTIENSNGPMGYGEVNIALGMAEKMVDAGDAEGWQDALYGTVDTTNADGTTVEGTAGILQLRADGGGWGKIAKSLGFSLGSIMGKAPTRDDATTTAKSDRAAKADRTAKSEHTAKPERAGKPERAAKPEQAERVARVERPERPERAEKPERPEKPERGGGRP